MSTEQKPTIGTIDDFLGAIETPSEQTPQEKDISDFLGDVEEKPADDVEPTETDLKPAEEEKEAEKEKEVIAPTTDVYSSLVSDYIEDGEWEDVILEINGEEVQLSTLTTIDKDTFKEIKDAQKQLQEEKRKTSHISIEGLDETTLNLIKIKKEGGDISPLLQKEAELVHPLKGYDLENPEVQEALLRWDLTQKGEEEDVIEYKIGKYKKEFTLDTESQKIVNKVDQNFKKEVEDNLAKQREENKAKEEAQKLERKALTEVYKSFNLKDSVAKNLLDTATKYDQHGLAEVDRLFFKAKKNPEYFAQVAYMLKDPKGFEEFKGIKAKNETALKTVKILSTIERKATNATVDKNKDDAWSDFAQK